MGLCDANHKGPLPKAQVEGSGAELEPTSSWVPFSEFSESGVYWLLVESNLAEPGEPPEIVERAVLAFVDKVGYLWDFFPVAAGGPEVEDCDEVTHFALVVPPAR